MSNPGDLALVGSRVLISDAVGDQTVMEASAGTFSVTADSAWPTCPTCPTGTQASLFVSHDGGRTWTEVTF